MKCNTTVFLSSVGGINRKAGTELVSQIKCILCLFMHDSVRDHIVRILTHITKKLKPFFCLKFLERIECKCQTFVIKTSGGSNRVIVCFVRIDYTIAFVYNDDL